MCTNNYLNKERFDKVIAKIKWCSFFASQCRDRKLVSCGLWAFVQPWSMLCDLCAKEVLVSHCSHRCAASFLMYCITV